MAQNIRTVLMKRDGLSEEEANQQIDEARSVLKDYLDEGDMHRAYNVCEEMFGLEPDYVMELL